MVGCRPWVEKSWTWLRGLSTHAIGNYTQAIQKYWLSGNLLAMTSLKSLNFLRYKRSCINISLWNPTEMQADSDFILHAPGTENDEMNKQAFKRSVIDTSQWTISHQGFTVYSGCLTSRSRAYRTCCCSTDWKMTTVMPPGPSTELDTFGGLVMSSLIEKMLAPGKRHRLSFGICINKRTLFEDLEKARYPSPWLQGHHTWSIEERSSYADEQTHLLYFF